MRLVGSTLLWQCCVRTDGGAVTSTSTHGGLEVFTASWSMCGCALWIQADQTPLNRSGYLMNKSKLSVGGVVLCIKLYAFIQVLLLICQTAGYTPLQVIYGSFVSPFNLSSQHVPYYRNFILCPCLSLWWFTLTVTVRKFMFAVPSCLCVRAFVFLNHLTDFNQTRYGYYAIGC
jgi:hypothetical protein